MEFQDFYLHNPDGVRVTHQARIFGKFLPFLPNSWLDELHVPHCRNYRKNNAFKVTVRAYKNYFSPPAFTFSELLISVNENINLLCII